MGELNNWREKVKVHKTFDEIYAECRIILLDTGVCRRRGEWYPEEVYPTTSFTELNTDNLRVEVENMRRFKNLFLDARSFSVLNVTREMGRFASILREKLCSLNSSEKSNKKWKRDKVYDSDDSTEINRALLAELVFQHHQVFKLSKEKKVQIRDHTSFSELEVFVDEVIEIYGCKEKKESAILKYRNWNTYEDLKADEQLASTALYLSTVERKPSTIITSDSDLSEIVYSSSIHLKKIARKNERFKSLKQYPVRVYYVLDENSAELKVDTSLPPVMVRREEYAA